MRKFLYPLMSAMLAASCSSNVVSENSSKGGSNASDKNFVSNIRSNAPNIQKIPPFESNSNAANSTDFNGSLASDSLNKRRNLPRTKSKIGDANAAPIPSNKAALFVAPDKSEISSAMNEKGVPVETRVFRNHPILAKTEKSFADAANPILKVYLKNGKILTVPKSAAIEHLKAPADDFLRAVGVNP